MSSRKHWPDLSSSGLSEDEKASIRLVLSLGRAFKSVDEYVRPRMRHLGLTMTEFSVLSVLYHNGETPLGQLSQRILLTGASTTYTVKKLEQRGLLLRTPLYEDHRVIMGSMTDKGRGLLEEIFPLHARHLAEAMRELSVDEKTGITRLLQRLAGQRCPRVRRLKSPMVATAKHTAHAGASLAQKLGLLSGKGDVGEVAILGEPAGFRELLLDLPDTAKFETRLRASTTLALAFIRSRTELRAVLEMLSGQLPRTTHIWLIHPKAHTRPDINQNDVRNAALDIGLVDYKVCSVSPTWSGLKFAWRGQSKSPGHRMKS